MSPDQPHDAAPPRLAYLLADAGITLYGSRKGCSIHARAMIRAMRQEGAQVDVYALRAARKGDPPADLHGACVVEIPRSGATRRWSKHVRDSKKWGPEGPPNWVTAVSWLLWQRDFLRAAGRAMAQPDNRPDYLYARAAWLAYPYARLRETLGVPLALEVNAIFSVEKADRGELAFGGMSRRIERGMLQSADLVLPVSGELAQAAEDHGAAPDRITVSPNAVDTDLFHPAAAHGKAPDDGAFVIGSVSSLRGYHGLDTLIDAAAELARRGADVRLEFVGDGQARQDLENRARQAGLGEKVRFHGVVPHERVPEILRCCDVCVSPNEGEVNRYNCPMKLYEYMALGVPVVASRWGDIPNILREGETALLHRPGDAADLARALDDVLRNPQAAQDRVARALEEVRTRHTWRARARAILQRLGEVSHG